MSIDTDNLEPNTKLGHYVILSRVAHGGMGVVYKAFEAQLERYVAIKVLRSEFAQNPTYVMHFQEEARAVAAVTHPNIVPIHYIGEEDGHIYFSMGFITGDTFDDWIEKERFFTEDDAFWFMYQTISALDFAQKANIIHLDIKPSNFLINQENTIILTDFGLAERLTRDQTAEKKEGFGTPPYVSPEQLYGMQADQRTDIYSLGATLYHMMVGEPPYTGPTDKIIQGHLHMPFPAGKAIKAGVRRGWVQLLEKMMQKDPDERFADYVELYGALEALRIARTFPLVEHPPQAVVATEVANWDERFGGNENAGMALLNRDVDYLAATCKRDEGKIIKTIPGGLLVSFEKADQALRWACGALEKIRSVDMPANEKLEHRMGMHFGPFETQGEEVWGESISLALKIQSEAGPGEVFVTEAVLDHAGDLNHYKVIKKEPQLLESGNNIDCHKISLSSNAPKMDDAVAAAPAPPPIIAKPTPKIFIYINIALFVALLIIGFIIYEGVSEYLNHASGVIKFMNNGN